MTNAAAQAIQNVAYLTQQIQEQEVSIEWDETLANLYSRRMTEVLAALRHGVPVATLSEVTGLGA